MHEVDTEVGRVRLRNDETLLGATAARVQAPERLADPAAAMARLTAVDAVDDIGSRPAVAAVTLGDEARGSDAYGLFGALFGRDSQYIARFAGVRWPGLERATFVALAALQGLERAAAPAPEHYDRRLEAPGRIPHEVRDPATDPIARMLVEERGWAFPYYHSDDATPLFVRGLAQAALRDASLLDVSVAQRDGVERTLRDALARGLSHIKVSLGRHVLLESERPARGSDPGLPAYPVWQDSPDAYFRGDGTLATGPMAATEVQAQIFDAFQALAQLVERDPELERSFGATAELRTLANELRVSFVEHLWVRDEVSFLAPGAERTADGMHPLGGRKSAMGHALDSAIFDGRIWAAHVDAIVHNLFEPRRGLVTPWGIRTLADADDHDRYRPDAYHNGNVWLFDNHVIAAGLDRHGYHGLARWLDERIVGACNGLRFYPEFIRGDSMASPRVTDYTVDVTVRDPQVGEFRNRSAQPPQLVQGWTLAAYVSASINLERMPREAETAQQRRVEGRLLEEIAHMIDHGGVERRGRNQGMGIERRLRP